MGAAATGPTDGPRPRLLVVHHTPSPAVRQLLEACVAGTSRPELSGLAVAVEPALSATAPGALGAEGYLLITPANIGYMSGAMKHFLDTIYYPCLGAVAGRSYGLIVHGNDDTAGAVRSVQRIVSALEWRPVAPVLSVIGAPQAGDVEAAADLAAVVGVSLLD